MKNVCDTDFTSVIIVDFVLPGAICPQYYQSNYFNIKFIATTS